MQNDITLKLMDADDLENLVNNPAARVPVCLCLDVSGSMEGKPIQELNEGVRLFYESVAEDPDAVYSAEISVIAFNSKAECVSDFHTLVNCPDAPVLDAGGRTHMGEAVNLALDMLEKRKQLYRENGIDYYQPWLVLMTDGKPNGSTEELVKAAVRTQELTGGRKLTVIAVGIGSEADMGTLELFSGKGNARKLKGLDFRSLFKWLSKSVSGVPGSNNDITLFAMDKQDFFE